MALPAAPDYTGLANQQAQASQNTAGWNTTQDRPNESNPFGTRTWSTDANGRPTVSTSLSPEQQQLYQTGVGTSQNLSNLGNQLSTGLAGVIGQPVSMAGAPSMNVGNGARDQVVNSLWDQYTQRMNPIWSQREADAKTGLENQGFFMGSEGANRAMDSFNNTRDDAYTKALQDAIVAGGTEQSRQLQMAQVARQQQLSEQQATRNQSLNELGFLKQNSGVTLPQFQSYAGAADASTPQLFQAGQSTADWNLANWNAEQVQKNNLTSGLIGLGTNFLGNTSTGGSIWNSLINKGIDGLTSAGSSLWDYLTNSLTN